MKLVSVSLCQVTGFSHNKLSSNNCFVTADCLCQFYCMGYRKYTRSAKPNSSASQAAADANLVILSWQHPNQKYESKQI